jgi:hypothetical protein
MQHLKPNGRAPVALANVSTKAPTENNNNLPLEKHQHK